MDTFKDVNGDCSGGEYKLRNVGMMEVIGWDLM